jgi:hypothetical protein
VRKAKSAVSRGLATEALRVRRKLELLHPPSHRGDTRIGGRGRLTANTSCDHSGGNGKHPQAEASRDHSGGSIKQADLAHLSSPVHQQPQQRSLRLSQAP